jgi:hypothetical protein
LAWLPRSDQPTKQATTAEPEPHARAATVLPGTGILWELWNWGAVPHWDYRIPYLSVLPVFEMPVVGYLGYPPFALAADALWRTVSGGRGALTEEPVTDLGQGLPSQPSRDKLSRSAPGTDDLDRRDER